MVNRLVILLAIFLIPFFLTIIFFSGVNKGEFLFIQDEFLILSRQESFNLFFTQNPTDLGTANTAILIVTFFDRLYYAIVNQVGLSVLDSQKLLYFLKLLVIIVFPFIGLLKLSSLFHKRREDIVTFIISLWYSFNTFTLIYWHGNAFSITLLICYALAPLAFYYYHQAVFGTKNTLDAIKAVLVLFLMAFALYFFAPFLLLLSVYTILYTLLKREKYLSVFKSILKLVVLFLPFASVLFLTFYDWIFNPIKTVNQAGGETYGNISGGLFYQLLMWFSWAIYTYWQPRNVYTFYQYFTTLPSLIAPFVLYALILWGGLDKKKNIFFLIFIFLLLFSIFFAKGMQIPFGDIYLYLINHSTIFRIFRSPDNKFGFTIVFAVTVLLLIVSNRYKKNLLILLISMVIVIQSYPLLNGVAIKGENTTTSSDRILSMPKQYQEVIAYLNNNSKSYGYIMPFPSVDVGHFELGDGSIFIGQDLLPKFTHLPFLYISDFSGMIVITHEKLSMALKESSFDQLSKFPIRYFIIRHNVRRANMDTDLKNKFAKEFKLVFKNNEFEVYENPVAVPLIQSENIQFERINVVKYRILIKNLKKDQKLIFYQNYNASWELFPASAIHTKLCDNYITHKSVKAIECNTANSFSSIDDLANLWKKPVFSKSHAVYDSYANSWNISPSVIKKIPNDSFYKVNRDGSVDVELILYLKTQSVFYLGLIISACYFLILFAIIIISTVKHLIFKRAQPHET